MRKQLMFTCLPQQLEVKGCGDNQFRGYMPSRTVNVFEYHGFDCAPLYKWFGSAYCYAIEMHGWTKVNANSLTVCLLQPVATLWRM